jgi:peptidoglycan/xylan/chitin deacetylase (PgdA/CDA1 family)
MMLACLLVVGCGSSVMVTAGPSEPVATSIVPPSGSPTPTSRPPTASPSPAVGIVPSPSSARLPPIPPGAVPILYYHRVEAPPAIFPRWTPARQAAFLAYDVIPAAFIAQLDWLAANGYTTILPRDLAAHWDHGAALPPNPVILTFDDGFHDWVTTVLPLLQAHAMVAEFYLTGSAIADHHIGWPEVRRLAAAGDGIGGHDVHHVQLAMRGAHHPAASAATMWAEVSGIRTLIAREVGIAPDSMAYVGGGFDSTLEALVRKAGYTTARSILRGIAQSKAARYALRVVRVGVHDDVIDTLSGTLVAGLPTFVARMHGVSDLRPRYPAHSTAPASSTRAD